MSYDFVECLSLLVCAVMHIASSTSGKEEARPGYARSMTLHACLKFAINADGIGDTKD